VCTSSLSYFRDVLYAMYLFSGFEKSCGTLCICTNSCVIISVGPPHMCDLNENGFMWAKIERLGR
jgi:hypothetical protein